MEQKIINAVFLIRSLGLGGTERQLVEVVKGLDYSVFNITVVSFYADGEFRSELEKKGVSVVALDKTGRWDLFRFLRRLHNVIKNVSADVVFSFLDVANLYALFAGKILRKNVVWGVRTSYMEFSNYDWTAGLLYRFAAFCSRFADLIIANSWAGKSYHTQNGYSPKNMIVIPNGINTALFQPDDEGCQRIRTEWEIGNKTLLIGLVGRLDKMKDHPTFLRAAAQIIAKREDVRFVCVGDGLEGYRIELQVLAKSLGLEDYVIWAGTRRDMPSVYSALDVLVSSSIGEGFSNVIGEAMACQIPCVVTDVGDSARIVGDAGWVVPPRSPGDLVRAIENVLALSPDERRAIGLRARQRVQENYSVEKMVVATEAALLNLVNTNDREISVLGSR